MPEVCTLAPERHWRLFFSQLISPKSSSVQNVKFWGGNSSGKETDERRNDTYCHVNTFLMNFHCAKSKNRILPSHTREVLSPHEQESAAPPAEPLHRSTFHVFRKEDRNQHGLGTPREEADSDKRSQLQQTMWHWEGAIVLCHIVWLHHNWCNTSRLGFSRIWRMLQCFNNKWSSFSLLSDISHLVDGSQNAFGPTGTALKLKNGTFWRQLVKGIKMKGEGVGVDWRARSMPTALEVAEMALEGHLLVIGTSLKHSGRLFCLLN